MNSLLFYIGNGVVKCGLSHTEDGAVPEILFWEKVAINHPSTINQEEMKRATLLAFDDLCQHGQKNLLSPKIKNKKIHKIYCVFSSPWYISETKTLKVHKPEPFLVKDDTVMELIEASDLESAKTNPEKTEVLERKIIGMNLNGYVTQNPIGKKTNTLEVSVVESFTDKDFLKNIKDGLDRYFGTNIHEKHFHSLPLVSFAVLRNTFKHKEDFLMVDVTSLLTEVSLIKGGLLNETVTLPIGTQKIVDVVVSRLNVTNVVAHTLLQLYQTDHVENQVNEKLGVIIEEFRKTWTESLSQAFAHLSRGISLPMNCFLMCQSPVWNFCSDFIKAEDYAEFAFMEGKFEVETIRDATFSPLIKFKDQEADPAVAIMAFFANIKI